MSAPSPTTRRERPRTRHRPGTAVGIAVASLLALALATPVTAPALDLVVGVGQGSPDEPVVVPIELADAGGLMGAALTITFDTEQLDVTAASPLFDSFAAQFAATGIADPPATSVEVGGTTFTAPFVTRTVPGRGLAVAGARRLPAPAGPAPLVILTIALRSDADPGLYPISIEPTVVSSIAAGYDPAGETLDPLVGFDETDASFPVLLAAADTAAAVLPGWARFRPDFEDADQDGLPDPLEATLFGSLAASDGTGDFDGDGVPDGLELFLGSDPTAPDDAFTLEAERQGDDFVLFFPMTDDHTSRFDVAWTDDLDAWSSQDVRLSPRPDLGSGEGWQIVEARVPAENRARLLMRLTLVPQPGSPPVANLVEIE